MTKIYVIDNGGQWTHREWRTLKYLKVDSKIIPNTIPFRALEKENIDGLVLSGGAPRVGIQDTLGNCGEYLKKGMFPILGICAGHQFMARFFNGNAAPAKFPEFGKVTLTLLSSDENLFDQVPKHSIVWESHNDEVTKLPKDFIHLAKSPNCQYQAMRHKKNPLYGVQFHPEVEHTEFGKQIFENFVNLCKQ